MDRCAVARDSFRNNVARRGGATKTRHGYLELVAVELRTILAAPVLLPGTRNNNPRRLTSIYLPLADVLHPVAVQNCAGEHIAGLRQEKRQLPLIAVRSGSFCEPSACE